MNSKTLLAFLRTLSSADTNLTNDPALKQLRNKLELLGQKSEITPQAWENIQSKSMAILENYAPLQQLYQDTKAKLEGVNIPPDLLPTPAELAAAQPANRKVGTLGYHPGKLDDARNNEIVNIGIIILSSDEPEKTAQTLLQRLIDWLKK